MLSQNIPICTQCRIFLGPNVKAPTTERKSHRETGRIPFCDNVIGARQSFLALSAPNHQRIDSPFGSRNGHLKLSVLIRSGSSQCIDRPTIRIRHEDAKATVVARRVYTRLDGDLSFEDTLNSIRPGSTPYDQDRSNKQKYRRTPGMGHRKKKTSTHS